MLENSVYSVITPEGCASILWRSNANAQDAAEAMKVTAQDLKKLEVIDEVIPEPMGGAHRAPDETIDTVGKVVVRGARPSSSQARPRHVAPPAPGQVPRHGQEGALSPLAAVRLSVLDQSPIRQGRHAGRCRARDAGAGAALRSAGLSPLLAGRASQQPGAGGLDARGADHPRRGPHRAHEDRLGRRDAAALQLVQGGRELPHAGDAVPRPHRSRHRPRAGQRPAHHARAGRRQAQLERRRRTIPSRCATSWPGCTMRCPTSMPRSASRRSRSARSAPDVWLLGSSDDSAALAAHFGLPFCYAHFINPDGGDGVTRAYRAHFRPSALHPEPKAMMAMGVMCAETDEEADLLSKSRELWAMRLRTRASPARSRRSRRRCRPRRIRGRGLHGGDAPPRRHRLAEDGARRHRGSRAGATRSTRSCW